MMSFEVGKTIGIIGGGHEAIGLTLAAKQLGLKVLLYVEEQDDTVRSLGIPVIEGAYDDLSHLREFAGKCQVVTYTSKRLDPDLLIKLSHETSFPQNPDLLYLEQDSFLEKALYEAADVPILPYESVVRQEELPTAIDHIGFPCILKAARFIDREKAASVVLRENEDVDDPGVARIFDHGTAILETWVPDAKIISIMTCQNNNGASVLYPVAQHQYVDRELKYTITPGRLSTDQIISAQRIADQLSTRFQTVGIIVIQFLVSNYGNLTVLHVSNRPTMVGDYSQDVTTNSHYTCHIRALVDLPLPRIELFSLAINMPVTEGNITYVTEKFATEDTWRGSFHDKDQTQVPSVMGSVTISAATKKELQHLFEQLQAAYEAEKIS